MKTSFRALPFVRLATSAVVLSCLTISGPTHAGDSAAGAIKAQTCLGCHGVQHYVNTYPTYHVPFIAGQNEEYLVAALKAYKSKERNHRTMQANATLLSDTDIADIAAYFAGLGKK